MKTEVKDRHKNLELKMSRLNFSADLLQFPPL